MTIKKKYLTPYRARKIYRAEKAKHAVLKELWEGEKRYILKLSDFFKGYKSALSEVLSPPQMDVIFFKIEEIVKCNCQIYRFIEAKCKKLHMGVTVSDIFLNNNLIDTFIFEYSQQCNRAPSSQHALVAFRKEPRVEEKISESSDNLELDLMTGVKLPTQRLIQYVDCFKKMAIFTALQGPMMAKDLEGIKFLIEKMQEILDLTGEKRFQLDHSLAVDAINQILDPGIKGFVTPHRRFIRQGEIFCSVSSRASIKSQKELPPLLDNTTKRRSVSLDGITPSMIRTSGSLSDRLSDESEDGTTLYIVFLFNDCVVLAERIPSERWKCHNKYVVPLKFARLCDVFEGNNYVGWGSSKPNNGLVMPSTSPSTSTLSGKSSEESNDGTDTSFSSSSNHSNNPPSNENIRTTPSRQSLVPFNHYSFQIQSLVIHVTFHVQSLDEKNTWTREIKHILGELRTHPT